MTTPSAEHVTGMLLAWGQGDEAALEKLMPLGHQRGPGLIALDDALQMLAEFDPRKCKVVELRFFGGLSVVYRARETRLNRDVAIKVLPADFAQNADRLRRVELEAKATGSLNHPNILTIYDIGTTSPENGGTSYLVAELLDGEELRAQCANQGASRQRRLNSGVAHATRAALPWVETARLNSTVASRGRKSTFRA